MTETEDHQHEHQEEKKDYKGKLTSKDLKNGPLVERKCTDILCLLFFTLFWAGMIFIAIISFQSGTPEELTHPFDQFGAQCGVGDKMAEFPYLYFIKRDGKFKLNSTVCLNKCPTIDSDDFACAANYNLTIPCKTWDKYATRPFISRICLPTNSSIYNSFKSSTNFQTGRIMETISGLKSTWYMLIVVALIALIIGFVYLYLIKYCAGVLVWGVIIVSLVLLFGTGFICIKPTDDDLGAVTPSFFDKLEPGEKKALGYGSVFMGVVFLILLCCFWKRINLSIAVLKTAAEFIEDEKGILFVPPLFFFISVIFYVLWIVVFTFILSLNEFEQNDNHNPLPDIDWNSKAVGMVFYYLFALIWNHTFILNLSQFFIASACCLWYFDQGKAHTGKDPIVVSIKRSLFHWGSIAFGSFLIGLLTAVRIVFAYVQTQVTKIEAGGPGRLTFIVKCCNCCMKCFDSFLKFLTVHAYIQIAMTGSSFCQATQDAFYLAVRNAARFGIVHGLAAVFLFVGKLFIALVSAMFGYLIITGTSLKDEVADPVPLTIMMALMAGLIGHIFMSVYGTSADTIIHCFAMDEEVHEGDSQYAPAELREFFEKNDYQKRLLYDN